MGRYKLKYMAEHQLHKQLECIYQTKVWWIILDHAVWITNSSPTQTLAASLYTEFRESFFHIEPKPNTDFSHENPQKFVITTHIHNQQSWQMTTSCSIGVCNTTLYHHDSYTRTI